MEEKPSAVARRTLFEIRSDLEKGRQAAVVKGADEPVACREYRRGCGCRRYFGAITSDIPLRRVFSSTGVRLFSPRAIRPGSLPRELGKQDEEVALHLGTTGKLDSKPQEFLGHYEANCLQVHCQKKRTGDKEPHYDATAAGPLVEKKHRLPRASQWSGCARLYSRGSVAHH